MLPCPGYDKQCCDEHWGARVSFRSGFLGVYAFLNEQCKEIEENNRVDKTGNLLKKIGDMKGSFIQGWAKKKKKKDRLAQDLKGAEQIKKR